MPIDPVRTAQEQLVIPLFEEDVENVQKLDDEPNDVGGLSAQELKEEFDRAGMDIKSYINGTLIPALSDTVAEAEARAQEEAQRLANELGRVAAEAERVQEEAQRLANELGRVAAEAERVQKETQRLASEQGRVTAEQGRVTAEAGRVQTETQRVESEQGRVTAEAGRVQTETQRVESEQGRVTAEAGRVQEESQRVENEQGRVTAEAGRVQAEQQRASETAGIVARATQQAQAAAAAKEAAEEARDSGLASALNAQAAAGAAHDAQEAAEAAAAAAADVGVADVAREEAIAAAAEDASAKAAAAKSEAIAAAAADATAKANAAEAAAKAASRPSTWTPTAADVGASATGHKHAAGDITSGTLAVARGGTGLTSAPSLQVNLASTAAAGILAASPRPGVTGTLPVANGGTGQTTLANVRKSLFGSSITTLPDFIPCFTGGWADGQYITGANLKAALGGTSVVFGAYTGTGSSAGDHAIALGFRPKLVIVMRKDGQIGSSDWGYLAMAGDGFPMGTDVKTGLEITAAGFIAGQSRPNTTGLYCDLNVSNAVYYYAAFK